MTQTRGFRAAALFGIVAVAVILMAAPVTITFAYSYGGYDRMTYYPPQGQQHYQLYWCNGYYSYSPCPTYYQQPTYYYYQQPTYYYYPSTYSYYYEDYYYYDYYSYNSGYNGGWNGGWWI